MKTKIHRIVLISAAIVSTSNAVPTSISAPVAGPLRSGSSAIIGFWVFNQHKSGFHTSSGGIGGADDTFAWDANLYESGNNNADAGKPVLSIEDGVVDTVAHPNWAGTSAGQILIRHTDSSGNIYYSGYLHLTGLIAKNNGTYIAAGTQLGKISRTGTTNDHLHFAVYDMVNGKLVSRNTRIVERTNRPLNTAPTISNISVSPDSQGNVTLYFNVNDTSGDTVKQTDIWLRSGTSVVSGTYLNGSTYTLGSHRVVLSEAFLRGKVANSGYYNIGVRSYDGAWLSSTDSFSSTFRYTAPVTATSPEIAIRIDGNEITSTASQVSWAGFGTIAVGSSDYRTYSIANSGTGTLSIGNVSLSHSDFTLYSSPASSLAPGQTTSFTIRFKPSSSGSKYCDVSVSNNDADENPYRFGISGTGQQSAAVTNAMDRFATSQVSWLGTYTGSAFTDTSFSYRYYSSGNWIANRIGSDEVWYQWNGQWYNGGNW